MGSVSGFTRASRARLRGARSVSSICAITFERSRMLPSLSASPGFSRPGGPYLSNLICSCLLGSKPPSLQAHAAVDVDCLAGHEGGLVGDEVNERLGDFFRGGKPPHGLAGDEVLACLHGIGEGLDPVAERRRIDRARADAIHADGL